MNKTDSRYLTDILFAGRLISIFYELTSALVSYGWHFSEYFEPDQSTRIGVLMTHGEAAVSIILVPALDGGDVSSSNLLVELLDLKDVVLASWELERPDRLWYCTSVSNTTAVEGGGRVSDVVAQLRLLGC